jgi:CheY-like chemotaxis protein
MPTILIIDDEAELTQVVRIVLKANSFQVLAADDGPTGVETARKFLPDLILCDVNMPDMNGYEVLAALRQNPITNRIPVILISGSTMPGKELGNRQAIPDSFLLKPFSVSELLAAVWAHVGSKSHINKQVDRKTS